MTGAAALTSSWLGARTAQEQIIAQHLQAAQQRIFEYVRDRREPRSQAYTDLIAQTQAVGTRISEMNRSEAYTDDGVHRILEEISTLLRSRARVMVEGPEVVADSTDDLIEAVMECQDALMALASIPGAPPEMRDKSHTVSTVTQFPRPAPSSPLVRAIQVSAKESGRPAVKCPVRAGPSRTPAASLPR
ncbi:hypothetical protein ACH4TQ_49400 [Streptomyces sp. NPDC021218]|uniref:hypothetical protein n=1 Tax=Streptomyces sp. NPDC021218 TaxID=3365119 RepID=UPI0037B2D50C